MCFKDSSTLLLHYLLGVESFDCEIVDRSAITVDFLLDKRAADDNLLSEGYPTFASLQQNKKKSIQI